MASLDWPRANGIAPIAAVSSFRCLQGRRINAQIEDMIAAMEREFLIVLYQSERDMLYGLLDRLQSRAIQGQAGLETRALIPKTRWQIDHWL